MTQEVFLEGSVELTPEGGTLADAGFVGKLSLSFDVEEFQVKNRRGGGGFGNTFSRPNNVKGTLSSQTFTNDMIEAAIRGESTTVAGVTTIEALVNSGKTYSLKFKGTNAADNDKQFDVDVYKIKFKPVKDLLLIGDDFGTLELDFDILIDATKTGAGTSKYFKIVRAD